MINTVYCLHDTRGGRGGGGVIYTSGLKEKSTDPSIYPIANLGAITAYQNLQLNVLNVPF